MKSMKTVLPVVLMLVIFSHCDSTSSDVAQSEPELLTQLTSPANNSVDQSVEAELEWNRIKGSQTYQLMISKTEKFESLIVDTTVNGTAFEVENLSPNSTHYWKVFPIKNRNSGPWSEVWSFTTGGSESALTTEMTLLSPENNADKVSSILEFSWKELENTSEYVYQLSDNSTFSSIILETNVKGTSYIPDVLVYQKRYHWRVKAAGDGNDWSEVWTFTTGTEANDEEIISVVTLLSPVHNADKVSTNLEFTWEALSGVSEYEYQLSDNSSFSSTLQEKTVSGTTYTPDGLVHQKRYHWRVKEAGNGDEWSEVWTFTTGIESDNDDTGDNDDTSTAVTLLYPQDHSTGVARDIEFSWSEADGISQYLFQISENNTFSAIVDEDIVWGTTYSSDDLKYDKTYFWRVKADVQDSKWSDVNSFQTEAEAYTPPPPSSGSFVGTHNANFVLNGEVFRFAGTNAYYLPNYEKLNPAVVDRALNLFQDTGVTVVRMWGFYDGYDCGYSKNDSNENVIQTAPGEYSEAALRDLDNVIAKGKERGISFIIPFINYWDELGGICQYNTWAGASEPSRNMEFFMSNSDTQKWYKDYIRMLLNRVNTVTGVAYKDEPAIAAWQIMNEGRNSGGDPTRLRDWYQEIAQYIKSIDPNHLVSTGEEGFDDSSLGTWGNDGSFTHPDYSTGEYSNTYALRANEGTSYVLNTAIPEIDFGNAHWYPAEFGFGSEINDDLLRAQRAWLSDHKEIAESSGKPFINGEFGFPGWGDERVSTMYNALYEHSESIRLDGNLLWQLTADGTKCWEFGGNICYPGGRADTQLYNEFKQHVTNMRNLR